MTHTQTQVERRQAAERAACFYQPAATRAGLFAAIALAVFIGGGFAAGLVYGWTT